MQDSGLLNGVLEDLRDPWQCLSVIPRASRSYVVQRDAMGSATRNAVLCSDCLQILPRLASESVDLVHTSPPYNIDKPYRGTSDNRGLDDYRQFLSEVIAQLGRIIKPGKSVFWQTGYTQADNGIITIDSLTGDLFAASGFQLWDRIVWRYYGSMAFMRKFTNCHETILWYWKPDGSEGPPFNLLPVRGAIKELDARNNFWGRNPGNVWAVDRLAHGSIGQSSHIAVFPEAISERIIRACSTVGDLIVDPFGGSGTVAKVAQSLDRDWLSIELSSEYAAETDIRLGYQQRGMLNTFASVIAKMLWRDASCACTIPELRGRLERTLFSTEIEAGVRAAETLTRSVFPEGILGPEKKDAKVDAWRGFTELCNRGDAAGQVVRILDETYKNRKHQTAALRYVSAMALLVAFREFWANTDKKDDYLRQLLESEWSTYQPVNGSAFVMVSSQPRIRWAKEPDRVPEPVLRPGDLSSAVNDSSALQELQAAIREELSTTTDASALSGLFDMTLFGTLVGRLSAGGGALLAQLVWLAESLSPGIVKQSPRGLAEAVLGIQPDKPEHACGSDGAEVSAPASPLPLS